MPEIFQHPELDGTSFLLNGGDIGVLLIHGFTATTVETRKFGEYLRDKGYTVGSPLLPGHGTSPEDLNLQKWKDWLEAAEAMLSQLEKRCRVLFVAGESMGGLLSLMIASRHPNIRGILLYAPAMKIPSMEIAWLLAPFKPYVWKGYVKRESVDIGWQGYNVAPLRAATQVVALQKQVWRFLPGISQPVIIFQGRLDQTIHLDSSVMIFNRIGSKDKDLIWLDNSGHCILLEQQWKDAADKSIEFIKRVIKEQP